jgi:hypothetical protein
MRIFFRCPKCKTELNFDDLSRDESPCPACGAPIALSITPRMREENAVDRCAICECPKVYVQKDFNRALGIGILATGIVLSLILFGFNRIWAAFGVLLGFALADALLYKLLPEVTICYRCHAQYRDFACNPHAEPFELGFAEKFDPVDKKTAENPAAEWKQR